MQRRPYLYGERVSAERLPPPVRAPYCLGQLALLPSGTRRSAKSFRGTKHPELAVGRREPEMGANVFGGPRTQRDPVRMFVQVKGSPFDSVRR
jgi:hypothetical protein